MIDTLEILRNKYNKLYLKYKKIDRNFSLIRLLLFFLFVFFIVVAYLNTHLKTLCFFISVVLLISFIIICFYHSNITEEEHKYHSFLNVIKKYQDRFNRNWINFEDDGSDLIDEDNIFLQDLDILGKKSLFQYLNIAKSKGGRVKLLEKLSNHFIPNQELIKRQESIKELSSNLEFCIEFQQQTNKEKMLFDDLQERITMLNKETTNHKKELFAGMILSFITFISLVLGMLEIINIAYFLSFVLLQLSWSYIFSLIYRKEFEIVASCAKGLGNMYSIFTFLSNQTFNSDLLKSIIFHIHKGKQATKELNFVAGLDNFRYGLLSYIVVNAMLPLNIYILYRFHKVKSNSFTDIKRSIHDFEELESLVSLSVIGVAKTNICMPTINQQVQIHFEGIVHPLLDETQSIANSFCCNDNVIIITGSNMSGKTTFMRTIGINLILMNAGTFVTAKQFSACYLKIFTSMRVKDDVEQGISTFYGELLRIKDIIDYQEKEKPTIAFIDEIFKGTNYNDRIFGAKEVIKKLSNPNMILLITTHDFELCDIQNEKVENYYFQECYVDEQIQFDYKIKEGKCSSSNAKYLMSKLNII